MPVLLGGVVFELTIADVAQRLTFYVVLLFAISVHESAHAWAALKMGDDTAARLGRISLNPLVHIDPFGTVIVPLIMSLTGIPLIGWAKPTPVHAGNFRKLARGQILVAGAGPASNFTLAALFILAWAVVMGTPLRGTPVEVIVYAGVVINVILGVFNLIPIPPLDGSWIASWGLPRSIAQYYDRYVAPYGIWILLLLLITGVFGIILSPFLHVTDVILRALR
jgi:Zn-dependent protease